jgi:MFS family permease
MITRFRNVFNEYSKTFWLIILAMFIDQLGGALIFPFFGLYITSKYNVGMTEVGVLFTIFALTGVVGSILGGALTDKFGRKIIIIFGLVVSALSSLLLAFAPNLNFIYLAGALVGLLGNMSGPAHQAMIADVLPEDKRADGFGMLRIIANLAVVIGPAIGGLLASRSYTLLFIIDVITSVITAFIFYLYVPETKPEAVPDQDGKIGEEQSIGEVLSGYFQVVKDRIYVVYIAGSLLMALAYMQMNTTLSVFLRDVHGIPDRGYGFLLSLNAVMVVLFQFWITRKIKRFAPMKIMAWGMVIYAIGFTMYGFVATTIFFVIAMVIITIGEMLVTPTGQAIVAKLSPEDMRGRYMAVYGFSWIIPTAVGPLAAGLIMDNYNPNWVWYASGISMMLSAAIFAWLQIKSSDRFANINGDVVETEPEGAAS